MAYETGTATGPDNLLDKLRLFLLGEGWTVNGWTTDGTGYRLHVQKDAGSGEPDMYFNFRSATAENGSGISEDAQANSNSEVTGLVLNGSTGYNAGNDWHKQPGYALNTEHSDDSFGVVITPVSTSAIPSYHFFTVGNSVHVAVEITSGLFQFLSFGMLSKEGVYTGGQYFTGSFTTYQCNSEYLGTETLTPVYFSGSNAGYSVYGAVYVNADSVEDWRIAESASLPEIMWPCVVSQTASPTVSQSCFGSLFWSDAPNTYNNISAFFPLYTLLKRSDDNYSLLGEPEGIRFMNAQNYSPAQEIQYGGDTWLVFPGRQIKTGVTIENENTGFAFKKVV